MIKLDKFWIDGAQDRGVLELSGAEGYVFKAYITHYTQWGMTHYTQGGTRAEHLSVAERIAEDICDEASDLMRRIPLDPHHLLDGQGPKITGYRAGQREAAALTAAALKHRTTPRVYIDAPTGSGKSVIGVLIASLISTYPSGARIAIATLDHQLQKQYEAVPGIGSITGRANWPCLTDPVMADKAPCATGKLNAATDCPMYSQCPYYMQKAQGLSKPALVSNYAYLLRLRQSIYLDTIIGDEGHDAEKIIREFSAVTLPLPLKQRIHPMGLPPVTDAKAWQDLISLWISQTFAAINKLDEVDPATDTELDLLTTQKKSLREHLNLLHGAHRLFHAEDYLAVRQGENLWVSPLVGNMSDYNEAVFMSATLVRPDEVDPESCLLIELPSTFPADQRPVISTRSCKLSREAPETEYRALARAVDSLLLKHNHEKGVVHSVSYELADTIKSMSNYPSLIITHGPGGRDAALEEFRKAPTGRVLISPAVATGVDLPYDLCRWQAIAKVPFQNLGDNLAKARLAKYPHLGTLDTARAIVQMTGRGMRAEDDSCATYVLDSNFEWFYKANKDLFPAWFREAVRLHPRA